MAVGDVNGSALPDAVARGQERLFTAGLYFVPIRHHSPACALALQALVREVRPVAVLIEGPDSMSDLLPLLLDERTCPPVAVLSQAQVGNDGASAAEGESPAIRSAFFPFCDYSPEWVALREGKALGAQLAFIDLPWHAKARHDDGESTAVEARSMMEERYLAHSTYLNALAARTGCRDHDELWDHLFELRPRTSLVDWRKLFADVFAYCAMARLDYEQEVLEAEGSLPRERHMAMHIGQWRRKVDGPIVVVTGGFHTPALLQMTAESGSPATARRGAGRKANAAAGCGNWLIRYSFDRLDALNGYAAGMPSPAYYQWVWECLQEEGDDGYLRTVAIDCLTALAQQSRVRGLADRLSTADVQAAAMHATRLAALRGHAGPGRQDLLDAVRSCFIKGAIDDGTQGLAGDLRRFLGGSRMGDIPPSAGSPPLIEDARRLARRHGVRLDDSEPRLARLDIYRKLSHRERSRFFHLMSYVGAGLATWEGGPDFLGNSGLDRMFEEWRHAWTPLVEARLIELAADGATLVDVALARLRREEEALGAGGRARSANHAVGLLLRACLIGLHDRLAPLLALLSAHLDEDENFGSIVACGHRLVVLWRAREPLGAQQHPELLGLLRRIEPAALYLVPTLADTKPGDEPAAIADLLSLRTFQRALRTVDTAGDNIVESNAVMFHDRLGHVLGRQDAAAGICGAAAAILFLDGAWSEAELASLLVSRFGVGAEAEQAVRFLSGMMAAAPELLLTQPRLRAACNDVIASWDEQAFVAHLPDLRHAFTALKPQETADLAQELARLNGAASEDIVLLQGQARVSEQDVLAGSQLQMALLDCLRRDALDCWVTTRTEQPHGE